MSALQSTGLKLYDMFELQGQIDDFTEMRIFITTLKNGKFKIIHEVPNYRTKKINRKTTIVKHAYTFILKKYTNVVFID